MPIFQRKEFRTFSILHILEKTNMTCKFQSDELNGSLIENNHEECSYSQRN